MRQAIQEVVEYTGLVRREEALLLCGPGISPLLTHPSSTSSPWEDTDPGTVLQPKPITLASTPELLVRTACPEPWFQATTRDPKEGGRKESQGAVVSGEQESGMEIQTFRPPFLPLRHLLSLVKPPGWEGEGQHLSHPPSCPARGGARPKPGPPGGPSLPLSISFSLHLGSRIGRMCVCVLGVQRVFLLRAYIPVQQEGVPNPWVWSRYPGWATRSDRRLCISNQSLVLNSEL